MRLATLLTFEFEDGSTTPTAQYVTSRTCMDTSLPHYDCPDIDEPVRRKEGRFTLDEIRTWAVNLGDPKIPRTLLGLMFWLDENHYMSETLAIMLFLEFVAHQMERRRASVVIIERVESVPARVPFQA